VQRSGTRFQVSDVRVSAGFQKKPGDSGPAAPYRIMQRRGAQWITRIQIHLRNQRANRSFFPGANGLPKFLLWSNGNQPQRNKKAAK
jgi:hypothetical protein